MSLSGALSAAVSALNSQSSALAIISNNLANSSTTGYKASTASFESLLAGENSSGGVAVSTVANVNAQGLLATSDVATNVAISGNGMFVVSDKSDGTGSTYYTRDGGFSVDSNGYLVSDGYYLEGYPTDADGNITGGTSAGNLTAIDTNSLSTIASPTTEASFTANLPADAAVGDSFTSSMEFYNSLGAAETTNVTWTKTADNTWSAAFSDPTLSSDTSTTVGTVTSGAISVTFNSDGTLASTNPSPATLAITSTSGAANSSITLDMGTAGSASGLSQYSTGSTTKTVDLEVTKDGIAYGALNGISIGDDGAVVASYDNGETRTIYKIPVATFANEDGLTGDSGGIYEASEASGTATLRLSGSDGAGTVYGGELEQSTTDTNEEFSRMMAAQQAYSGAAQVMSTANSMFSTLIQSIR